MGKWDGLNRRKFPRVNYPCMVVIQSDPENSRESILTHTDNVGIGGVCVILKRHLKIFCPVEVELDLLDLQEHIKCQGKVVWSVQRQGEHPRKPLFYDVGIEFVNVADKDQQRLEIIVQHLAKNPKNWFKPEVLKK